MEDSTIGSDCSLEVRSRVKSAVIADNCCIGAAAELRGRGPDEPALLPPGTAVSAPCGRRVAGRDPAPHRAHVAALLDVLRDRLPRAADLAAVPWTPSPRAAAAAPSPVLASAHGTP